MSSVSKRRRPSESRPTGIARIAAGIDGFRSGEDAAALAAAIAEATGAELLLVSVHPDPLVAVPPAPSWKALHTRSEAILHEARDRHAPDARVLIETDWSVARGLERAVAAAHRDLLVVGSSRHAREGRVQIGKRTRQLLGHARCALAVAPAGLSEHDDFRLARIGVGFDGGPESEAALSLAAWLAEVSGASLHVLGVVDDRLLPAGSPGLGAALRISDLDGVYDQRASDLRRGAERALGDAAGSAAIEIARGRPADALAALAREVDLLLIGSRRWGGVARVLLGSTGEALMHGSSCPVLVVPRSPA